MIIFQGMMTLGPSQEAENDRSDVDSIEQNASRAGLAFLNSELFEEKAQSFSCGCSRISC